MQDRPSQNCYNLCSRCLACVTHDSKQSLLQFLQMYVYKWSIFWCFLGEFVGLPTLPCADSLFCLLFLWCSFVFCVFLFVFCHCSSFFFSVVCFLFICVCFVVSFLLSLFLFNFSWLLVHEEWLMMCICLQVKSC